MSMPFENHGFAAWGGKGDRRGGQIRETDHSLRLAYSFRIVTCADTFQPA